MCILYVKKAVLQYAQPATRVRGPRARRSREISSHHSYLNTDDHTDQSWMYCRNSARVHSINIESAHSRLRYILIIILTTTDPQRIATSIKHHPSTTSYTHATSHKRIHCYCCIQSQRYTLQAARVAVAAAARPRAKPSISINRTRPAPPPRRRARDSRAPRWWCRCQCSGSA